MTGVQNPALAAFIDRLETGSVFGQVLVRRSGAGFELCHVEDRSLSGLKPVAASGLRPLARFTATGVFRPLKSAPTLRRGWVLPAPNPAQLGHALDTFYPGGLADWYAAEKDAPAVTGFRECVERQTGMYRITALLSDEQAGRVVAAGCAASLCLKRRLWAVPGCEPDPAGAKSVIPCLEPCALFLEFARKAMRIEQEEGMNLVLAPSDLATIRAALATVAAASGVREGDVASPGNPRRALLALAKLDDLPKPSPVGGD